MKLNHRFLLRKGDLSIGVSGTVAANSPTSARVTAVVAYDLNPFIGLKSFSNSGASKFARDRFSLARRTPS